MTCHSDDNIDNLPAAKVALACLAKRLFAGSIDVLLVTAKPNENDLRTHSKLYQAAASVVCALDGLAR